MKLYVVVKSEREKRAAAKMTSFSFEETLGAADEFKSFILSEKRKIYFCVLNP